MRHAPIEPQLHEVSGARPTVVLLHSSGVSCSAWLPVLRALEGHRHAVAPSLLGYGRNPRVRQHTPFSVHDDLALLERLVLRQSEPVDLVGHSYGGWLALQLASKHPQHVRQVITHEPALWGVLYSAGTEHDTRAFETANGSHSMFVDDLACTPEWMRQFTDFWSGEGTWDGFTARRRRLQLDTGWKIYEEARHACLDRTPHSTWAQLPMPVRLTVGQHAPLLERRVLELLLPHLQHGSLLEVAGGHMAPVTHPHSLIPHLLSWLGVCPSHAPRSVG